MKKAPFLAYVLYATLFAWVAIAPFKAGAMEEEASTCDICSATEADSLAEDEQIGLPTIVAKEKRTFVSKNCCPSAIICNFCVVKTALNNKPICPTCRTSMQDNYALQGATKDCFEEKIYPLYSFVSLVSERVRNFTAEPDTEDESKNIQEIELCQNEIYNLANEIMQDILYISVANVCGCTPGEYSAVSTRIQENKEKIADLSRVRQYHSDLLNRWKAKRVLRAYIASGDSVFSNDFIYKNCLDDGTPIEKAQEILFSCMTNELKQKNISVDGRLNNELLSFVSMIKVGNSLPFHSSKLDKETTDTKSPWNIYNILGLGTAGVVTAAAAGFLVLFIRNGMKEMKKCKEAPKQQQSNTPQTINHSHN